MSILTQSVNILKAKLSVRPRELDLIMQGFEALVV